MIKLMKSSCLIFALISFFSLSLSAQHSIRLQAATVIDELEAKLVAEPSITAELLAEAGNRLAKKQGYGFIFDPGSFKERIVKIAGKNLARFDLTTLGGRKVRFLSAERGDHPCGTWAEFPVSRVTSRTFTLISDGKTYDMVIPKQFGMDEIVLVDKSFHKMIHRWTVPLDSTPAGISQDGTKIYIQSGIAAIFIEIDAKGHYKYVATDDKDILKTGVDLEKFPKDKNNDYLGFRLFTSGKTTYLIKFSHPCT